MSASNVTDRFTFIQSQLASVCSGRHADVPAHVTRLGDENVIGLHTFADFRKKEKKIKSSASNRLTSIKRMLLFDVLEAFFFFKGVVQPNEKAAV